MSDTPVPSPYNAATGGVSAGRRRVMAQRTDQADTGSTQCHGHPGAPQAHKAVIVTPTWRGLLPALLAVYEDSQGEGRRTARAELDRMAQVADIYVRETYARQGKDAAANHSPHPA